MAGGSRSSPIPQQEMADQAANTSAKRNAEETQTLRSKLVDQHLSILNYPDPLKPRAPFQVYPQGITPEVEAKWLQMLKQNSV
ncbi:hypothetical protein FVEG_14752 [Fusarium verticillioides 7600]|uniref:Uncharacterized protein n=1 Tax=Gibberella moniliformis (strain M3125 / FGSC 7600) TaxID=334819 RepID=W7LXG7_GIBM7|nr:hypothetical protein FVEG_14752 [Fusarium verticillioides 7600]EWG37242.1 hypothetical protein FVEG_14752 [Fusarium verticillioides 7600]RBQ76814.1 hypothetical protein FVER14953_20068 [Fusarium verticillioides]RBQ84618.1 hypothetical protein FVER53263_20391 [Fusarium verticillioides]RBR03682.1 hypothetical protein FVER53590_29965 [Fusarium verticillioides]